MQAPAQGTVRRLGHTAPINPVLPEDGSHRVPCRESPRGGEVRGADLQLCGLHPASPQIADKANRICDQQTVRWRLIGLLRNDAIKRECVGGGRVCPCDSAVPAAAAHKGAAVMPLATVCMGCRPAGGFEMCV